MPLTYLLVDNSIILMTSSRRYFMVFSFYNVVFVYPTADYITCPLTYKNTSVI